MLSVKPAKSEAVNGTSLKGYISADYSTLVEVFGPPHSDGDGYKVDAVFRVTPSPDKFFDIEVHEVVPFADTLPAPDGGWWRCEWGGQRKCFFGPMMGM